MKKRFYTTYFFPLLFLFTCAEAQQLPMLSKTLKWKIPDVEQPLMHTAPFIYYTPVKIFLTPVDTVSALAYWRRNFTDQFLETWAEERIYPASRIFGFIQDSIYFRSTEHDQYHIFAPQIFSGQVNLYYTRHIQNLGEIRMTSKDSKNMDYQNSMIVTGDVPQRYANEFTYFITFPWDSAKMIPVTRSNLGQFSQTYLRAYPDAYREAMRYVPSPASKILNYTLLPLGVICSTAFLLSDSDPVYLVAVGAGALVTYFSIKIFLKPKVLDPEAMIRIIEKTGNSQP
jgi:hypothetical protein